MEQDSVGHGRFVAIMKTGKQENWKMTFCLLYAEFAFLARESMIKDSFRNEDYNPAIVKESLKNEQ